MCTLAVPFVICIVTVATRCVTCQTSPPSSHETPPQFVTTVSTTFVWSGGQASATDRAPPSSPLVAAR